MGLDQWLYAKTTKRELNDYTGICNGLFGMIPAASTGMVEIGYWRKAYDQDFVICKNTKLLEDEQGRILITREEVDKILSSAKLILNTHEFEEESGEDLTSSPRSTWQSKRKWEDTIKFFTEAKQILKDDPDAEIYYYTWY